jgi:hypothetical protein
MPATSALWITGPGAVAFRDAPLPPAGEGDVLVEAAWSGISLGIEALVLRGGVPVSERRRMRAPFQAGDFPWPVRYGYAAVGRVVDGPTGLASRTVFVLHPHQDRFTVPATMAVPARRRCRGSAAVLAASMETALNVEHSVTASVTAEGEAMYSVEVRDHAMIAHSLPAPVFGAEPAFAGRLTTTEALSRHVFDALAATVRGGRLADGGRLRRARVALHESHVARAWYEAEVR